MAPIAPACPILANVKLYVFECDGANRPNLEECDAILRMILPHALEKSRDGASLGSFLVLDVGTFDPVCGQPSVVLRSWCKACSRYLTTLEAPLFAVSGDMVLSRERVTVSHWIRSKPAAHYEWISFGQQVIGQILA
jgi:hypothetical protein